MDGNQVIRENKTAINNMMRERKILLMITMILMIANYLLLLSPNLEAAAAKVATAGVLAFIGWGISKLVSGGLAFIRWGISKLVSSSSPNKLDETAACSRERVRWERPPPGFYKLNFDGSDQTAISSTQPVLDA
ncbi:hypothetical protein Dimus_031228 [Dionaea muscipula]